MKKALAKKRLVDVFEIQEDGGIIGGRLRHGDWKAAREARGWTQARMAELCGVQRSAVAAWEAGTSSPGRAARARLFAALPANGCPGCGRETASAEDLAECAALDRLTREAHKGTLYFGAKAFALRRKRLGDAVKAQWIGGKLYFEVVV